MEVLIASGADVNLLLAESYTPIYLAAYAGQAMTVTERNRTDERKQVNEDLAKLLQENSQDEQGEQETNEGLKTLERDSESALGSLHCNWSEKMTLMLLWR